MVKASDMPSGGSSPHRFLTAASAMILVLALGLDAASGGGLVSSPLHAESTLDRSESRPFPDPSFEAGPADCVGGACEAPVILVQEGSLRDMMNRARRGTSSAPRVQARTVARDYEQPRRQTRRAESSRQTRRAERRRQQATRSAQQQTRSASRQRQERRQERRSRPREAAPQIASGETFTTMCVRTCDGYFFPISFSTTEDRFEADEAACQARCPGMEVDLYVHRVLYETSDQMRSAEGTPYSDLTTAFLYRLKGPENTETCGCRVPVPDAAAMSASAEDGSDLNDGLPLLSAVPLPRWRPDPNAPEVGPLEAIETATLGDDAPRERTIRVVGPAFFPDR